MLMCAIDHFKKTGQRLSGSALFYALLITTLVGIVLTALLSIWMYFRASHQKDLKLWDQLTDLESAYLYAAQQDLNLLDELFIYGQDSVLMTRYHWGIYDVVHSRIPSSGKTLHKTALLGFKGNLGPAMELLDTRKQLALSGKSQIRGNAVLPSSGITTTTVNGKPFQGGTPLVGTARNGEGQSPELDTRMLDRIMPTNATKISLSELADSTTLHFWEAPLHLTGSKIELKDKHWTGPIFVAADSLIVIDQSCHLDGVILQAPQIQIDTSFSGRLQAFATLELAVGPNSTLTYPSVLAIIPQGSFYRQNGRLRIDKNSKIDGFILGLKSEVARESQLFASLDHSDLKGRFVWQGGLEASGRIEGAVYCDNFFYRGSGGQFYFNYLVDCTIDGPSRSEHWVEPLIWNQGKKQVAQWLD